MTNGITPFVTVLIPAYNAAATIRRALDSVFRQDYPAFEIVVVDDGSADQTSKVVASYGREEIRLLRLARNRGEGGVLNEGIAIAKGEYIAFLDADDEWLPTKLVKQIALLEANPKASMATCGCLFVDPSGHIVEYFGMPPAVLHKSEIWRSLLVATGIAKPCVVARTALLARVGPFDTTIPIAADQDMWIRLAMAGEVEFVPEYLTVAHDTPGSLTKTYVRHMDRAVLPMVSRYLQSREKDLSQEEIRKITYERRMSVGRNLYINGRFFRGLSLILQALLLGGRPTKALWYLAAASPPARAAKQVLLGRAPPPSRSALRQRRPSLLAPTPADLVTLPDGPPILIVTIDTEAEFDWAGPFLRTHVSVNNLRNQVLAQDIFDRFGVRPTYFVDYAVATQSDGYEPLLKIANSSRCEIGAHLQSWETPPFAEELSDETSFNHNLPAWLQAEKLSQLTEAIVSTFGIRPISYRAGRYGVGDEIAWILNDLGYRVDMSVLPGIDLRRRHGPDFRQAPDCPYWFGPNKTMLEIPMTAACVGLIGSVGLPKGLDIQLYDRLSRPNYLKAHVPGVFARCGLLERIVLTPEGTSAAELLRLTRSNLARGRRVFVMSYHSSSLLPGSTHYVRSADDLSRFLGTIEAYLRFFFEEIGGVATTPTQFRETLLGSAAFAPPAPALSVAQ